MITDIQFRQLISSYIMDNLSQTCVSPDIEKIIAAVIEGITSTHSGAVYDSFNQSHIEESAEHVLKNELNRQLAEYDSIVKESGWLKRLLLTNYLKQFRASIEEYRLATEDICLKH